MLYFFIFSKIFLAGAAFYSIVQSSPWVVAIFVLFIAIDLVDSEVMGSEYRPYDTFFDRAFAYLCFLAFFFSGQPIFPVIIYITAFFVRDYFVLSEIQKNGSYFVSSNLLDRTTMFLSAMFFSFHTGGIILGKGIFVELMCYVVSFLILYQGIDKIKRIRSKSEEVAKI